MIARLRAWWLGLARRERVMTAAAAALVLLALLFLVAIEPAWKTRARLAAELPKLRAQVQEVDALAQEARGLQGRGVAAESAGAARAALEQSLARANLAGARVAALDERRIAVNSAGVPVAQWLAWAEEAARESRLRIATVRLSRGSVRAIVDAEAVFELMGRQ
ncbi:MAG TPA: type II secretion system protein GspM [Burkholderiales bacterium]|nr:type II secretion system protein GspM [Burkholderiales bacterium]